MGVVNAMAMTFILGIDELILERFGTTATRHIMDNLESYPLFTTSQEDSETPEETYERTRRDEELDRWVIVDWKIYALLMPKRLFFVVLLTAVFLFKYYESNCYRNEHGIWVSKDMYLPASMKWDPVSLIFGAGTTEESEPFWTMRGKMGS